MISDQQRREVAAKMREIAHIKPGWTLDSLIVAAITSSTDAMRQPISETVADLIDRPTCEMKGHPGARHAVCTRCGALVRRDAVADHTGVIPVKFCPNCSAEVVNDA